MSSERLPRQILCTSLHLFNNTIWKLKCLLWPNYFIETTRGRDFKGHLWRSLMNCISSQGRPIEDIVSTYNYVLECTALFTDLFCPVWKQLAPWPLSTHAILGAHVHAWWEDWSIGKDTWGSSEEHKNCLMTVPRRLYRAALSPKWYGTLKKCIQVSAVLVRAYVGGLCIR